MANRGLIFIPDISGFTRFVNDTDIEHSRHIIQELLETIINANEIGLSISEIEGDAILFYRYGDAPDINILYKQVEKMFYDFHRHLISYELCRICQCTACRSAVNLSLKVITHYGDFTNYNVKGFEKLIGKDIIVAHQLLKNNIDQHEYWLVTDELMKIQTIDNFQENVKWNPSFLQTENGNIPFQFIPLSPLKKYMPSVSKPQFDIGKKVEVLSLAKEVNAGINSVFYTAINFSSRQQWFARVKKIDDVSHALPRVGTSHCCVLEKGQEIMYTSDFSYSPEKIMYCETDNKKSSVCQFTFEKKNENLTRFTIQLFLKKNILILTMFRLFMKRKIKKSFMQSLENLAVLVKQVNVPA